MIDAKLRTFLYRHKLALTIEYRQHYVNGPKEWFCTLRDLTGRFVTSVWSARRPADAIKKNVAYWKKSRVEKGERKIPRRKCA